MHICGPHLSDLTARFKAAGLEDFIEEAQLKIMGGALECGGGYLLEKDYCPLCELDLHARDANGKIPFPPASSQWIMRCQNYYATEIVTASQ